MRQVLLLRGVNVGPRHRIAMAALREVLSSAGCAQVRTYMQSGNVVLASELPEAELARLCERRIAERFGFAIDVFVRSAHELEEIVASDPLAGIATDPRRYQVSFCATAPPDGALERLTALATPRERVVALGRELYAWHPNGIARSKLWAGLAGRALGVRATARNWATVTALAAMATDGHA